MSLLVLLRTHPPAHKEPPVDVPEITLWDEFDNPQGAFPHYDAHDAAQRIALHDQAHVNLRSMVQNDTFIDIPMAYLDLFRMALADNYTMEDLEATTLVRTGERWTNAVVAKDPTRKNWRILTMLCQPGMNVTESRFAS